MDLKTKEEKDAELDRRIEALRKKNEALMKRHQVLDLILAFITLHVSDRHAVLWVVTFMRKNMPCHLEYLSAPE